MHRAIVLFTVTVLAFLSTQAFADTLTGKVIKVAHGDTITVLANTNTQHRIRLQGTDAPEKGQPFGNASRKHLASLVPRCEKEKGPHGAGLKGSYFTEALTLCSLSGLLRHDAVYHPFQRSETGLQLNELRICFWQLIAHNREHDCF